MTGNARGVSTSRNATSGDVYPFGIRPDDSSGGFSFYAGMTYDMRIGAETWKVVQTPFPQEASGKYKVDNGKLVFSIENYRFSADSPRGADTPDQTNIGKDFTVSDLPAKFSETAHAHLNGEGDRKSPFKPTPQGFRIKRTDASYVDCI